MLIDTPSTAVLWPDKMRIASIRWDSEGAVAGQNAVITDKTGRRFWAATAAGANSDIRSGTFPGISGEINGLVVPVLDSGLLYISYA